MLLKTRTLRDRWMPATLRRIMSYYVSVELTLTPWLWDLYLHTGPADLTARVGPVGLNVINDGL